MRRPAHAFAGDDERDLVAVGLHATEEGKQRFMRLPLRHAMQIDAGFDGLAAARNALPEPSFERRERWRFYWRWQVAVEFHDAPAGAAGLAHRACPAAALASALESPCRAATA